MLKLKLENFKCHEDREFTFDKDKMTLMQGNSGQGKCMSPETDIIMYDGTIKKIKDIEVGEKIMGDDSTCRNVLSICSGEDEMYEVIPTKGESYKVNSRHILSLKCSTNPVISWDEQQNRYRLRYLTQEKVKMENFSVKKYGSIEAAFFAVTEAKKKLGLTNGNVFDVSINDYFKRSTAWRTNVKGYKVGVDFDEQKLDMDPYLIGYWLGDGDSYSPLITTKDQEIVDYYTKKLNEYELCLKYRGNYHYGITRKDGENYTGSNTFLNCLRQYNLLKNKHIPHVYKCNSRENRMKLLAGLIDSDGSLCDGCYGFNQKSEKMIDDVIYLCRSLGFSCYKTKCEKACTNAQNGPKTGTYYRICISGQGLEEIPVLLEHKKYRPRKQIKNGLVTGIKVKPIGKGKYNGFQLDGNQRFLMGDFTVTHNSTIVDSILFVLYDSVKKPCTFGKTKCSVLMNDGDVEIYRQKGPGRLHFKYKEKKYEDDAAQEIINRVYGNEELFMTACCTKQLEKNILFYGTNKEKLRIIKNIAFRDNNLDTIKDTIDQECSKIEKKLAEIEQKVQNQNYLLEQFDKDNADSIRYIDNLGVEERDTYKELNKENVEKDKKKMEIELDEINQKIKEISELNAKKNEVNNNIKSLSDQIKLINIIDTTDLVAKLDTIKEEIENSHVEKLNAKKELETIEKRIVEIDNKLLLPEDATLNDVINKVREKSRKNSLVLTLLSQLKCHSLDQCHKQLQSFKDSLDELLSKKQLYLDSLAAINHNLLLSTILQCPSCHTNLRNTSNNCLEICTENTELHPVQFNISQSDISSLDVQISKITHDISFFESSISTIESYGILIPKDDEKYHKKLLLIQEFFSLKEKKLSLSLVPDNLRQISQDTYQNLVFEQKSLTSLIQNESQKLIKLDILQKQLVSHQLRFSELVDAIGDFSLDSLRKKHLSLKSSIESKSLQLKFHSLLLKRDLILKSLSDLLLQKQTISLQHQGYIFLKQKSIDAECLYLEKTVDILNLELDSILEKMFDFPISVSLHTSKFLKTNKRLSYKFDIKIFYKNQEYDSISQLSGGEQSRLSLALTLAFNKLTNKRIILLDETLNSLNLDLKMDILEILSFLNKTIIIISHEEISGIFDSILNL